MKSSIFGMILHNEWIGESSVKILGSMKFQQLGIKKKIRLNETYIFYFPRAGNISRLEEMLNPIYVLHFDES